MKCNFSSVEGTTYLEKLDVNGESRGECFSGKKMLFKAEFLVCGSLSIASLIAIP